jgi:hypothetical protein
MPDSSSKTSYLRFKPSERLLLDSDTSIRTGVDTWVVIGGVSFYVGIRNRGSKNYWVYVPKGYSVTGADIPAYFQRWILPTTNAGKAAIIHNYLCRTGRVRINGVQVVVDRKEAARIFYQAMRVAGVWLGKRFVLYLAARLSKGHIEPDRKTTSVF